MFAWDIFRFEKLLLSNAQFNDSSLVYKFENERILTGNAQITFNLSTWTEFLKCPKQTLLSPKVIEFGLSLSNECWQTLSDVDRFLDQNQFPRESVCSDQNFHNGITCNCYVLNSFIHVCNLCLLRNSTSQLHNRKYLIFHTTWFPSEWIRNQTTYNLSSRSF